MSQCRFIPVDVVGFQLTVFSFFLRAPHGSYQFASDSNLAHIPERQGIIIKGYYTVTVQTIMGEEKNGWTQGLAIRIRARFPV